MGTSPMSAAADSPPGAGVAGAGCDRTGSTGAGDVGGGFAGRDVGVPDDPPEGPLPGNGRGVGVFCAPSAAGSTPATAIAVTRRARNFITPIIGRRRRRVAGSNWNGTTETCVI